MSNVFKKISALMLSLTLILSAIPIIVSANTVATTTVVTPTYKDANGNALNILHTSEADLPSSVLSYESKYAQISTEVVENTTHLPITNLFAFEHPAATTGWSAVKLHTDGAAGKGALFYVEAPQKEGGFRVSIYMIADNASKYATNTSKLYYLGENDTEWQSQSARQYGILLESGFKGYIYIPFNQLTGGTGISNGQVVDTMELWMAGSSIDSGRLATPEGQALIMSAPLIVEGNVTDSTLPAADKFTAIGQEFYYFDSKRPKYFPANTDLSDFHTPELSGNMIGSSAGTATEVASITNLSQLPSVKISNFTPPETLESYNTALATSFYLAEKSEANIATAGVMIYVKLKNVNNPSFYFTAGSYSDVTDTATRVYSNSRYSNRTIYYLEAGTTVWKESESSTAASPYWCQITETGDFEGYIYYPWASSSKPNEMTTALLDTFSVYINKNSVSEETAVAEDVFLSAPILVDTFMPEEMTVCVDSAVFNMLTGETIDFDYYSPKAFYGNTALISSPLAELTVLITAQMKTTAYSLATPALSAQNYTSGDSGNITVNYVEGKTPIIKAPTLAITIGETALSKSDLLNINMNNAFAGTEGIMLYVENPAESEISLNFGLAASNGTDSDNITWRKDRKLRFIANGSDEWAELATAADGFYSVLPAGFKGYIYLDYDNFANVVTKYMSNGTLTAITVDAVMGAGQTLYIGTPMSVINYAENIADMALVNGSAIAQDMFTGDFVVPYDTNGDLIAEDRAAAAHTPIDISSVFDSLTADADNLLVGNPDRGYRTEMVLYIKQGSPKPMYYDGEVFTTLSAAETYISTFAATEGQVDLIQIGSGNNVYKTTMNSEDTFAIDVVQADSGSGDGEYRVYRAFSDKNQASYFIRGSLHAKGDVSYGATSTSITTPEGTESTVYRVKYDDRMLFTDWDEAKSRTKLNQIFNIYFKSSDPYSNYSAVDQTNMFLAYIYLTDWNGSTAADTTIVEDLSAGALQSIEYFFKVCDEKNVKSMLRFCYNNNFARNQSLTETQPDNRVWMAEQCANEGTIIRHTEQLSSLVGNYRHTIHSIENGFVGYVGEWAYSYQWPEVSYVNVQKKIVENLCVPNGLYFSARAPEYKQMIADADPDWEYMSYISHNNDASYGETTKDGWHSGGFQKGNPKNNATDWWEWMTAKAAYTPQGGEMFVQSTLIAYNTVPSGMEMILQLAHHRHTSFSYWHGYLEGLGVSGNIMKAWMNEAVTAELLESNKIIYDPSWFVDAEGNAVERNAYEYIRDHLGYRIALQNASVNWSGRTDEKANVQLTLKNYGFSAAFNLNSGFVILDSNYNVVSDIRAGNPDTWYSLDPDYYTAEYTSASESIVDDVLNHTVEANIEMPTEAGTYYIGFYLKDSTNDFARFSNDMAVQNGYHILSNFTIE